MHYLLAQGASPETGDQFGRTFIHILLEVYRGDRRNIEDWLDMEMEDLLHQCAFTELHASAAMLPGADPVSDEQLRRLYLDINTPDIMGTTALDYACRVGRACTVRLLLQ